MAWPSKALANDFWTGEFAVGGATHRTFEGEVGLAELDGPLGVTSPAPSEFWASLTRVQFARAAIERFDASAHEVDRGPAQMQRRPAALIAVVFVLEGQMEVRFADLAFPVAAGQAVVMDTRVPASSTTASPIRLLRAAVAVDSLPLALTGAPVVIPGPLPRTALLDGYAAFCSAALQAAEGEPRPQDVRMDAVLAELQAAVVAEAQRIVASPRGSAALRYRIEACIQQHHTDPTLDVAGIARSLQVSVGYAHQVFDDGGRTIGRVLRERRVATAARLLRAADGAVHHGEVATRSGFGSRAALNRAFQQLHGMSPREYREREP